jgi:hypothetical protein
MNKRLVMKSILGVAATLLVGMANPQEAYACRTSLGDFVWVDSNGNGVQDAGEPGINGVRLTMTTVRSHGTGVFETVTANDPVSGMPGWYTFGGVECGFDYTVAVDASTVPAGYSVTSIHAGSDPALDSNDPAGVTISFPDPQDGTTPAPNLTLDFGYLPACTGAIGDYVWNDANRNGIQDAGESGIAGALVDLNGNAPVQTSASGGYLFTGLCGGSYTVCVQTPAGYQISPANAGNDALDSDGVSNGVGKSCATVTISSNETNLTTDFGFNVPPVKSPGTGTPGYWKNHPEAWPVDSIVVGGVTYSKEQALANMTENPKDKTSTIFRHLLVAKLNVLIGNDDSCIAGTISAADAWLVANPLGSGVRSSSLAWRQGEPLSRMLDNYNNGMLCAPHRD